MREYIVEFPEWVIDKNGKPPFGNGEQIVRCRDCKYIELITVSYSKKPLYACDAEWCMGSEGDNPLVKPNGFCAWAERNSE